MPGGGEYRTVELIGTTSVPVAADTAANRCSETVYPYPAADNDPLTLPNLDGPVRPPRLARSRSATTQTIEFCANGTAYLRQPAAATSSMIPVAGITITLERNGMTTTITVNGLGKVQLQQ